MLNLTSAPADFLGAGGSCSWQEQHVLKITFGSNPTLVPGDTLYLREAKVQSAHDLASLFASNQSSVVLAPNKPTVPLVVLSAPDQVGVCDDLTLDASATLGSGGRPMTYTYTIVEGGNSTALANISHVLGEATSHTVTLSEAIMPKGAKMEVSANQFPQLLRCRRRRRRRRCRRHSYHHRHSPSLAPPPPPPFSPPPPLIISCPHSRSSL